MWKLGMLIRKDCFGMRRASDGMFIRKALFTAQGVVVKTQLRTA